MKKILTFILTAGVLISCSNSDDNTNITGTPEGNWRISLYWDETDETSDFNGYTFTFGQNNILTATNGTTTKTGTYSQSSTKLVIDFGTDLLFGELNDDWLIVEKTNSSLKLKDDNPAQDDRLEFIRI